MLNATAGYSWIQPKCVPKCVPIFSINSLCGSPREPEWTGFVEHAGGAGFAGANVNSAAWTKRVLHYDAKGWMGNQTNMASHMFKLNHATFRILKPWFFVPVIVHGLIRNVLPYFGWGHLSRCSCCPVHLGLGFAPGPRAQWSPDGHLHPELHDLRRLGQGEVLWSEPSEPSGTSPNPNLVGGLEHVWCSKKYLELNDHPNWRTDKFFWGGFSSTTNQLWLPIEYT